MYEDTRKFNAETPCDKAKEPFQSERDSARMREAQCGGSVFTTGPLSAGVNIGQAIPDTAESPRTSAIRARLAQLHERRYRIDQDIIEHQRMLVLSRRFNLDEISELIQLVTKHNV